MNTTQLECFLAVAENLSFARAAEQLHITQPAVTHQINSLENELNVKLFNRSTREVSLTLSGWDFRQDAHNILRITNAAKVRLGSPEAAMIRPFGIGLQFQYQMNMIREPLRRLTAEQNLIHPFIRALPMPALSRSLQDHSLDIILGFEIEKEALRPGIYRELTRTRIVCIAAPGYLENLSGTVTRSQLTEKRLINYDNSRAIPRLMDEQSRFLHNRGPLDICPCDQMESAVTMVQSGIGFALIPEYFARNIPDVCIYPLAADISISMGVYYRTLKGNPDRHRFLDLLTEEFNS